MRRITMVAMLYDWRLWWWWWRKSLYFPVALCPDVKVEVMMMTTMTTTMMMVVMIQTTKQRLSGGRCSSIFVQVQTGGSLWEVVGWIVYNCTCTSIKKRTWTIKDPPLSEEKIIHAQFEGRPTTKHLDPDFLVVCASSRSRVPLVLWEILGRFLRLWHSSEARF